MSPLIHLARDGPVFILSLNHPERHNSLRPEILRETLDALAHIRDEPGARAVVLQAKGRSFSTGGDLRGFYEHLDSIVVYANEVVGLLNQVILDLFDLPLPVVAAVHGIVTGGSLGLILVADIVVVTPEASFTPYYPVVGFSPDGGWTALLPKIIGPRRTAEILMTNRTITAEEAVAWGLANKIVQSDEIQAATLDIAHAIAKMQPESIRQTKRLLSIDKDELDNRLRAERQCFIEQINTAETQGRMIAFLEKMES